ncbi:LysR family transcriptional regulator [Pigmentiphaga sp. H8]|uniref:LysR family transcriptional regulator n=1 Tax=unclassified Pigmentiphaga TaxID=2626614 RepID=UPI000F59B013|nr:LysR family transcriptional regulator [Pigmentiphaga sp. H8]AZG11094.1 LysR family transcriptional regulator [Pigmentiphaga sp. H8]
MDLRQLRYFVVLATQQHYGRASSILHVAQPALSRQIKLLEDELGVQLFERHPRGAAPTAEALFLLERASFLLRYAEQVKQDLIARQRDPRGPVAIGLSPALALLLAAPLTQAMRARYPDVRLRIIEGFSQSLHDMLGQGSVDVAILNGPMQLANLHATPLMTEALCLIGPANDARLRGKSLPLQRLAGVPLVMTGVPKSGVRLELEAAAAHAGVELESVVEVETITVASRLVREGLGMTVHFAAVVKSEIDAGQLAAIPVEGLRLRRILARAADRPPSRATEVLIASLQQVIADQVRAGNWPHARLEF